MQGINSSIYGLCAGASAHSQVVFLCKIVQIQAEQLTQRELVCHVYIFFENFELFVTKFPDIIC
jgi:hypothetical protein